MAGLLSKDGTKPNSPSSIHYPLYTLLVCTGQSHSCKEQGRVPPILLS